MEKDIALILWKHSKNTEADICIPKQNIKQLITELNNLKNENTNNNNVNNIINHSSDIHRS